MNADKYEDGKRSEQEEAEVTEEEEEYMAQSCDGRIMAAAEKVRIDFVETFALWDDLDVSITSCPVSSHLKFQI